MRAPTSILVGLAACVATAVAVLMMRWQATAVVSQRVAQENGGIWNDIMSQAAEFRQSSTHSHARRRYDSQWGRYPVASSKSKQQLDRLLNTLHTLVAPLNITCPHDGSLPASIPPGSYLIGLNLHNSQRVLPQIMIQLTLLILGIQPDTHIFMSVYESGSTDETVRLLSAFKDILLGLRVPHRILAGSPDSIKQGEKKHRIAFLANMRNRVLEPLWPLEQHVAEPFVFSHVFSTRDASRQTPAASSYRRSLHRRLLYLLGPRKHSKPSRAEPEDTPPPPVPRLALEFEHQHSRMLSVYDLPSLGFAADRVIFVNDVFVCVQDVVRLASHSADVVCGTDFNVWDKKIKMYDTWVIRDVSGAGIIEAGPPYFYHRYTAERLARGLPAPMYSCWNGMVVLSAAPFRGGLRMRSHAEGECAASECSLMADDFWRLNYTRVLMDPRVRLVYGNTLFSSFEKLYDPRVPGYLPVTTWGEVLASPVDWLVARRPATRLCCEISPHDNLVLHKNCTDAYDPFRTNFTDVAMRGGFQPSWVSLLFS